MYYAYACMLCSCMRSIRSLATPSLCPFAHTCIPAGLDARLECVHPAGNNGPHSECARVCVFAYVVPCARESNV
jgi:hypothetical protein